MTPGVVLMDDDIQSSVGGNAGRDYYKYLRRCVTSKSTKPVLWDNWMEVLKAVDEFPSTKKSSAKQFVVTSSLLSLLFHKNTVQRRKINLTEAKNNPRSIKSPTNIKNNGAFSRCEFLPEAFKKCKSQFTQCAVVTFCLYSLKDTIKKDLLFAMMNGAFDNVNEVLQLQQDGIRNIRERIQNYVKYDESYGNCLITAMLETADILKDKTYSRLAYAISPEEYINNVKHLDDDKMFHTVYPYDALIHKYISTCIAAKSQAVERDITYNQFNVNAKATIEHMLNSLPIDKPSIGKNVKFADEQKYYVFEAPVNFTKDLVYMYKRYEDKIYQIITYKDCLYDVLGTKDSLFMNKSWRDRLDSIDYTAKIIIHEKTGADLNKYNGNATLAICWMEDDGLSYHKYHTFLKRERKKI